jgi:hypothetical protein
VSALDTFSPISLTELTAQAELLRRYDTKYLLHVNQLPELYVALSSIMSVLEHEGSRCVPYTTTYFDTADLRSYHDHLKGRRKRFKVRTRHYQSPQDGFLEIKIKKPRGQTQKVRWICDVTQTGDVLSHTEMSLINEALRAAFYDEVTDVYGHVLQTTFDRTTLFDAQSLERITIDTNLRAVLCGSAADGVKATPTPPSQSVDLGQHHAESVDLGQHHAQSVDLGQHHAQSVDLGQHHAQSVDLGQHCAVIEIKSPVKLGHAHRVFSQMGIRPATISKCCASLSALRPDLVGSPWKAALRQLQGSNEK